MTDTALPISLHRAKRLRREVTTWARQLGFRPQMAVDDPEAILEFMERCLKRSPGQYTLAHGSEIFRWCKEHFPYPYGAPR